MLVAAMKGPAMGQYASSREQVVSTCRELLERGYLKTTEGNVSVRVPRGMITLAGSRMYTSMADTDELIDDALERFEGVLASVEGL